MSAEAEQRAREAAGESLWSILPQEAKDLMIGSQQALIDAEQRLTRYEAIERERENARRYVEQFNAQVVSVSPPTRMNRYEQGRIELDAQIHEDRPEVYLGGRLLGFRRETINRYLPQMDQIFEEAHNHARRGEPVQRSAMGYMMFYLWAGGMQRASTKVIFINNHPSEHIDALYNALDILLQDKIEKCKDGYEEIYGGSEDRVTSHLKFYFRVNYYPEPKCVKNWGENVQPIESRPYFDIFTASEVDPCALQVSKELWGPDATEDTIDKIVKRAGNKVCILKPHMSIQNLGQIKDYSDLVPEIFSPVQKMNVVDNSKEIIYLLHYNEHLGLLTNLKEQKRYKEFTSFRPMMKYPNTKKITVCFDIECYFDPYTEESNNCKTDQRHVPYLCCACFMYDDHIGNVMEFEGKDCILNMLTYASEIANDFAVINVELVAHNGGGYDFHYLLTSIYNPSIIKQILVRNNRFITFQFVHNKINYTVKDSYNFIGCSLQMAARSFLSAAETKTDFPHHEVRKAEDLERVFQEWISVDKEISVQTEKEKLLITSKNMIKYKENGDYKKLIEWAKQYCINDVIVLANVWSKFKQVVFDIFRCRIVDQTMTLAGLSFRLFEAHLPYIDIKIKLHHPPKTDYMNMRKALVGGRCISVNGMYENIVCLDVKSLYPTAMAYYPQPYGQYKKTKREIKGKLGIYYCKVELGSSKHGHGFFPIRINNDIIYTTGSDQFTYNAWYTSVDIQIGREEGNIIEPIAFDDNGNVGYVWSQSGFIFKEYIESVLYKLKLQYEKDGNREKRQVIKIIMNSLWGKFAQKWMEDTYRIKAEYDVLESEEAYKLFDSDYFIIKGTKTTENGSKPIQNGVFVLSWARYHMFELWKKTVKPGTICLYSDTDSIMVRKEDLVQDAVFQMNDKSIAVIGDEMGQLELENTFDDFIAVGKKQYIGKYTDPNTDMPQYKKRFKGVPHSYITPDLYVHLLKNTENYAQIEFLRFQREWGCVRGFVQLKTVAQT
jgi:hypothetical protein